MGVDKILMDVDEILMGVDKILMGVDILTGVDKIKFSWVYA